MSHRVRLAVLAAGTVLVAAGLVIALLAGPFSENSASKRTQIIERCRPGTVAAEGPFASGEGERDRGTGRACVLIGQPETFDDMSRNATGLAARDNAPFTSQAPGAYLHAVAQRASMPAAGAAVGTGFAWEQAGSPPECADQTTNNVCPAPSDENGNYSYMAPLGFRTLTGRISSFAYDPSTQGRYFASPVVGGVWETTNSGGAWRSIGDGLPTQAVGGIAYDAPRHRILVGTGDNSFGQDGIAGHGLFYSDDDGQTWTAAAGIPDLALTFKVVVSPADSSGQTVYVATSRGLFRSTDGGASFVNENLPTSPSGYSPNCAGDTTNRLCFFANIVTDVVVKPTGTSNAPAGAVLAAIGWRAGAKPDVDINGNPYPGCKQGGSPTMCLQSPQNGLYESSTGAPGSFHLLPFGNGAPNSFAPSNVIGRTALAVAHGQGQDSDAVYALVEDVQKFKHCPDVLDQTVPAPSCNATVNGEAVATVLDGMYASYDFGTSWTKIMDFSQLKQPGTNSALTAEAGYSPGVQAWYNLWVEADPTATDSSSKFPTRLLFGLEEVWENNPQVPSSGSSPPSVLATPYTFYPGGSALNDPWLVIGRYWNACGGVSTPVGPCNPNPFTNGPVPGTTVHPDQHAYAMVPDGKGGVTLLIGSDGGAYSQHVAAGQSFSNDNWGDGLNATLPAVQPYDAEMAKDGTIVSGLQDNGELKIAPSGHEAEVYGGDAFFNTIDPSNSKNFIEEYTYAQQVNLTLDGGSNWFPIQPSDFNTGSCGGTTGALFSTPIEQDPTEDGHVLIGCGEIQEATNVYANPCAAPPGATAANCQAANVPFNTVFDLNTLPAPTDSSGNKAPNIPSALAVRQANEYVGYCGYCDPATQRAPFANGIATNVGGSAPPKIGTGDGWHQADANCAGCGTANGKLPERLITSIQEDPSDPNTVYVTLGGYNRHWIPPGSYGEDLGNVGNGHLFVSHDHGQNFVDISGNLPDVPASFTAVHNGQLIVATDLGVYIQQPGTAATYGILGTGLPMTPVFTVRVSPADPSLLLVSTYGRGDFTYSFRGPIGQPSAHVPGGAVLLTTSSACAAGAQLVFRINPPRRRGRVAGRVVKVVVYVNGGKLLTRKARRGHAVTRVSFGRPTRASFTVKIVSINNRGGRVITTRLFGPCARSKVKGKTKHHKRARRRVKAKVKARR